MKIIAIIPARFASTRFPGKPLVHIQGKPMVQRVYEKAISSGVFAKVIVATDDARIEEAVIGFGGEAMITSEDHQSGTDRCGEVISRLEESFDVVVNIQGDEPFIHVEQLEQLIALFQNPNTQIATLKKQLNNVEDVQNMNVVKVVSDNDKRALYFSRSPIPFARGVEIDNWLSKHNYYKHIGLYGYRYNVLKELVKLPTSSLESCESLEQLRWLQNGFSIFVAETKHESIGIDTPEDLERL
jgi:3-deoxy-manno-octulosonate cytidylyltransferase (CMP-KDO synthetase)